MINFETASGTLYQGHVIDVLKTLPEKSIYTCVTSPPYWGLRDYGTLPLVWPGSGLPNCEHIWEPIELKSRGGKINPDNPDAKMVPQRQAQGDLRGKGIRSNICHRCGAWLGSLGLEDHPDRFIEHLVEIFREVRRVLRDDGTLWLNLGDTYAGGGYRSRTKARNEQEGWKGSKQETNKGTSGFLTEQVVTPDGYKPKDLMGIPWRTAIALQEDGWYLRNDIIWAKPNPMPESVTDRCTKSHEYIFLLSKNKNYYFDNDAIREPHADANRMNFTPGSRLHGNDPDRNDNDMAERYKTKYVGKGEYGGGGTSFVGHSGNFKADGTPIGHPGGRNKRTVWTVTPKPYKGAHFAVFPQELITPCVLAGAPENGAVLDPFFGSGTTGLVSEEWNRRWVGVELNPEYCELAQKRLANISTAKNVINEIFS
jgi:DNA modification methylase